MNEHDLRIRNHVYASFVADAHARTAAEAAEELDLAPEGVEGAYRRLHEAHALVLGRNGRIRMLNPFSAVPTPHAVEAGGREWFANCAWDALGIPGALHVEDAAIRSECPDCGEELELELHGGELVQGNDLLVHFVVPARRWWDDIGFT